MRVSAGTLSLGATFVLMGCGGGGASTSAPTVAPAPAPLVGQAMYAVPAAEGLTIPDVETVIAQAVSEAKARNLSGVIAVVDRPGNVLAVFRMNGASPTTQIRSGPRNSEGAANVGLQGVDVPRELAAISKALTGAYLSSGGNAFSTRTASMIVQEHFPPSRNAVGLESGPLFGVQFSQLPCSDLSQRDNNTIGPKRAPLGLAADPGGFPLYKNGVVVGGIGVSADGDYGFDTEIDDIDRDDEELIAVAGMSGFAAPLNIRADRISVDGTTLRFLDRDEDDLQSNLAATPSFASVVGTEGILQSVNGYTAGNLVAGQIYSTESSGMRPATSAEYTNPDVFVLSDGSGVNRFPPRGGTDGGAVPNPLTAVEVQAVIEEAFDVMTSARAQIRRPLNSRAQVSISVVDTFGTILGVVRSPDAPIFGTDVSLQKARTATFFSNVSAGSDLSGTRLSSVVAGAPGPNVEVSARVPQIRAFLNDGNALTGTIAFADRSGGNLSRPFFPDGEVGTDNGPLSRPISEFSPFATGLQEDIIRGNILEHVTFVTSGGLPSTDTAPRCTFLPDATAGQNRLQNGIQIFPGSVPIYKGNQLVGGIGVSGDGIDQDDMISFLGVYNAGVKLGTLGNAPVDVRADTLTIPVRGEDIRLRYVSCPFAPFLDSNDQNPCEGK